MVAEIVRLSYLLHGIEISTLINPFFIITLFFVLILQWSARPYLKAETVESNLGFSDRAGGSTLLCSSSFFICKPRTLITTSGCTCVLSGDHLVVAFCKDLFILSDICAIL